MAVGIAQAGSTGLARHVFLGRGDAREVHEARDLVYAQHGAPGGELLLQHLRLRQLRGVEDGRGRQQVEVVA